MEELSKLIDEGHPDEDLEALKAVFKAVKKVAKEDYGVKDEEKDHSDNYCVNGGCFICEDY